MEGVCACMCERGRMGKVALCSLILNEGREMTSWKEMDQRFIGPAFSTQKQARTPHSAMLAAPVPLSLLHLS